MTYGAEIWGPALVAAGSSWLSGQGSASGESKMQRTQRKLVDKLLSSINGNGPYSDLFNADQNTFQKSFVDPAKSMFNNQIAPQIQQQYIASGQQRGSGLDDQLLRAGVDLDQLLNQQMYQFNNDATNRKQNSINAILQSGSGAANKPTGMQDVMSGLSGYLASDKFSDQFSQLFPQKPVAQQQGNTTANNAIQPRKGFSTDNVWSQ